MGKLTLKNPHEIIIRLCSSPQIYGAFLVSFSSLFSYSCAFLIGSPSRRPHSIILDSSCILPAHQMDDTVNDSQLTTVKHLAAKELDQEESVEMKN